MLITVPIKHEHALSIGYRGISHHCNSQPPNLPDTTSLTGIKMFSCRIFLILLFTVTLIIVTDSKSLEGPKDIRNEITAAAAGADEMMETAEAQNPFLPRFAMKALRKRNELRAQRRKNPEETRVHRPLWKPCRQRY